MLALVHIEKSGGKTLARVMRREYGLGHCDYIPWRRYSLLDASGFRRLRKLYPHLKSMAGHLVRPYTDLEEACPEVRYYTILREPVERAAAHYDFHVTRLGLDIALEEWISQTRHQNRQCTFLAGCADAGKAIEVVREKLLFVALTKYYPESMVMLKRAIGDPNLCVWYPRYSDPKTPQARMAGLLLGDPYYRAAPPNSVAKEILTDRSRRRILEQGNQEDSKLYQYVTEELWPRQIEKYGAGLAEEAAGCSRMEGKAITLRLLMNRWHRNLIYRPVVHIWRLLYCRGS